MQQKVNVWIFFQYMFKNGNFELEKKNHQD